ncbi:MAG: hypothetical protein KJO33_08790, partial [Gammaproteobacteria bacterium]|nr:hypothetical protein [Gammaproteobacteria bacterium]
MASDGNQVLVVWVSRYAKGGNPNYAMSDDERLNVATYLGLEVTACTDGDLITTPCLYLEDHFSVAGSQRSSDLADEGYPLIGELPYAAVWAARGVILPPEATELEATSFVWFKAERLSSAVRDANRPEAKCVKGAGCVVSWQEDPDGIRPGSGDGPGEGWSGAIAHHQTDTWYSYIGWDEFSLVGDGDYGTFYMDGTGDLAEWVAANGTGQPQAAIPMSIPVRLTDNAMCVAEGDKPYCYADFDDSGTADFCADSVNMTIETPEGPTQDVDMCITEDGRLLRGNTASTRARLGLHGYSTTVAYSFAEVADNSEFFNTIDSAWLTMSYEENKGLGDCEEDPASEDPVDKVDMGKNVWYHTFDMFNPELVSQGLMLNQPAIYPDDFTDPNGVLDEDPNDLGFNFFIIDPDPIYETTAGLETTLYQTEIARRPSQITQNFYDAGPSGTVALQLWKQGIVRRGGPADIMGRRFVIPTDGTSTTTHTLCTTFNEVCDSEYQVCTVPDCEIFPNEDYKYTGQCKKPNPPTSCYLYYYLDENGDRVYTNDPEDPNACLEPVCGEWQAGFCPTDLDDDQTCEQVSECLDPVEGFCPSDLDPLYQYCEESTECHTVPECPADTPDYQECTTTSTGTDGFDSTAVNPYAYDNMVCDTWAFTEGLNPRYVKGFCADPAINLSGNTILTSESCGDAIGCRDAFPFSDYFDDIDMTDSLPISKIYTWEMIGPGFTDDPGSFEDPLDIDGDLTNLNDTSWANPYDMAKGHRGFMTGDMIMAMYAWTPNWNDLTNAHSIVNLYVRRSFDGGLTWSTTPGSYTHTNGETYSG